eukprot:195876-Chlamydomonas_euryale.AAC.1
MTLCPSPAGLVATPSLVSPCHSCHPVTHVTLSLMSPCRSRHPVTHVTLSLMSPCHSCHPVTVLLPRKLHSIASVAPIAPYPLHSTLSRLTHSAPPHRALPTPLHPMTPPLAGRASLSRGT